MSINFLNLTFQKMQPLLFRSLKTLNESRLYGHLQSDGAWEADEDKNSYNTATNPFHEACIVCDYTIKE